MNMKWFHSAPLCPYLRQLSEVTLCLNAGLLKGDRVSKQGFPAGAGLEYTALVVAGQDAAAARVAEYQALLARFLYQGGRRLQFHGQATEHSGPRSFAG